MTDTESRREGSAGQTTGSVPRDEQGSRTVEHEAIYNIGAVARMTGVPVATIRVWERRYGFPQAQRTEGGHRIYSEPEVARLAWVKGRVDDGMQPSKAVRALEVALERGRFPASPLPAAPSSAPAVSGDALEVYRERFTWALLENDLERANQLLGDVTALYGIEDLILNVLRPAMADIGEGWSQGRVSVATEHLASQFVRERLVRWMYAGPPAYNVGPLALACAPNEWHDLSLLMFGTLMRRRRWPVAYLGQALPLDDLAGFVRETSPAVVALVAMREASADSIIDWPSAMPDVASSGRPRVCFGGRVFAEEPEWVDRVPGVYLGPSLEAGVDTAERLLRESAPARALLA
ncbi:MAG: MerR family transcriptional regulator [Anaerolineae bacterium]